MKLHDFISHGLILPHERPGNDRGVLTEVATAIVRKQGAKGAWFTAFLLSAFLFFGVGAQNARAGQADVIAAQAVRNGDGSWTISATLRHADSGWDHYADRWEVVAGDGDVLAVRNLAHPHVNEQPFTRSLSGVILPEGITTVTIRAHDSVHGYGGRKYEVKLDY
ncbi:hypothetical protein [Breoghania sp.]|uniref:hypothetical protein n=1 Tax=Breoghania sp. TaxID=2065378 RepID=UPI002AA664F0|nr:hypothetical protein [Breoghania sp.]